MLPPGATRTLRYDPSPGEEPIKAGDFLRTSSGRCYLVIGVRLQEKGKYIGRLHLGVLVSEGTEPGAVVHDIQWMPRGRP